MLLGEINFMNACSITMYFMNISVCSKVLVGLKKLYGNKCLSMNSAKMNS
jgi:hypothetical protein